MIHIEAADLHKSYGGQSVLNGLSFAVMKGEHVGLVGANGAGKTTLLRIMTGSELPDAGGVILPKGATVGLLSQLPVYPEGATGRSVVGAFEYEADFTKVCRGLELGPVLLNGEMSKLSGGERTRVELARLLLKRTDILLLDEPTNHLDLRVCEWLEEYLSHFKGTALAVSHDRYFLDRFAERIIEINGGKAVLYNGNYSFYAEEREARRAEQERAYEKEKREYDKVSQAAVQMHAWAGKNAKLHRRAFAMEKRAERILKTEKPTSEKTIRNKFGEADFRADDVFRLENISKRFGERVILNEISLTIRGGERVALLGANGAGKTTLLNIFLGNTEADGGYIWRGPSVKEGYLPQLVTFENTERSLVDTLVYELDVTPSSARNRLAAFHFTGDKVFDAAGTLSGGERSRLKLCMLMAGDVNLLVLDEPTNHLDIASREWIESALDGYEQTMLFVSHDRYFIEQFATRVWWIEDGVIWDFRGDYPSFAKAADARAASAPVKENAKEREKTVSPLTQKRRLEQTVLRYEKEIEKLETELHGLDKQIEEASTNGEELMRLLGLRDELEKNRDELYEKYEAITSE